MGFEVDFNEFSDENMKSTVSNCTEGAQWIWTVFAQCVTTPIEIGGFYLGLFSIVCWFIVYIPQMYENYKRGKCEDALSIWFLLFWLLGDTCNLTGCFLTHQFPIQTMTAIYYVFMDLLIIIQFVYYAYRSSTEVPVPHVPVNVPALAVVGFYGLNLAMKSEMAARQNLYGDEGPSTAETVGYVIGLLSTVFYLGSRLPQIIMNFKRGKTDGVHPLTFLLAVVANFAYAFSVLMSPRKPGQSYEEFIMDHLPWLTGSLGTVSLDFTILMQCICLNRVNKSPRIDDDDDEEPLLNNEHERYGT